MRVIEFIVGKYISSFRNFRAGRDNLRATIKAHMFHHFLTPGTTFCKNHGSVVNDPVLCKGDSSWGTDIFHHFLALAMN